MDIRLFSIFLCISICYGESSIIRHTEYTGHGLIAGCPKTDPCGPAASGSLEFGIYTAQGLLMKSYDFQISGACGYALYIWAYLPSYEVTFNILYNNEQYVGVNRILLCPNDTNSINVTVNGYSNTDIKWRSYPADMQLYSFGQNSTLKLNTTTVPGALSIFTTRSCKPLTSSTASYITDTQIYGGGLYTSITWNTQVDIDIYVGGSSTCTHYMYLGSPLNVSAYLPALALECSGTFTKLNITGRYYDKLAFSLPFDDATGVCKLYTYGGLNETYISYTTLDIQTIRNINRHNHERYWYGRWNLTLDELDNHLDVLPIYAWDELLSISSSGEYEKSDVPCSECSDIPADNIVSSLKLPRLDSVVNKFYTCESLIMESDGLGPKCTTNNECLSTSGICNLTINLCISDGKIRDRMFIECILNISDNIRSYSYLNRSLTEEWMFRYNVTLRSDIILYFLNTYITSVIEGPNRIIYMKHRLNYKTDNQCSILDDASLYVASFSGGATRVGCRYMVIHQAALSNFTNQYVVSPGRLDIYSLLTELYSMSYYERTGLLNNIINRNNKPSIGFLIGSEYCAGFQPNRFLPMWKYDVDVPVYISDFHVIGGEVAVTEHFDRSVLFTTLDKQISYTVCVNNSCAAYYRDIVRNPANTTDTRCKSCPGARPIFGLCPSTGGTWITHHPKAVLYNETTVIAMDITDDIGILLRESTLIVEGKYNTSSIMKLDNSSLIIDTELIVQNTAKLYLNGKSNITIGKDLVILPIQYSLLLGLPGYSTNIILSDNSSLNIGGNINSYEDAVITLRNRSTISISGTSNNTIILNATDHSPGLIVTGPTSNIHKYKVIIPPNNTESCKHMENKYKQNITSIWLVYDNQCTFNSLFPIILVSVSIVIIITIGIVVLIYKYRTLHNKVFPFYETAKKKQGSLYQVQKFPVKGHILT